MTYSAWTKDDIRAARQRTGLSAAKFAAALGLGKHGYRTVRRWESGEIRITLRTQKQIEGLLREHRPGYAFVGRGSIVSAKIFNPEEDADALS